MRLYIVVPCYNEQEALPCTAEQLKATLLGLCKKELVSSDSKILFVDDGSTDNTWNIISALCSSDDTFEAIRLSKNEGHQNALLAGLMTAKDVCDAAISIDADLQDDVCAMEEFVRHYLNGCDVVFGVRKSRDADNFVKRSTATAYYKLLALFGHNVIKDHADFRLMSRRALDALSEYKETNLFLRGIARDIGFKTECVYYDRKARSQGGSKYSPKKMLRLACDGLTSNARFIDVIAILSVLPILLGAGLLIFALIRAVLGSTDFNLILLGVILLLSGIQLVAVWIVGKYVGKTLSEVKGRPRYIISEKRNCPEDEK